MFAGLQIIWILIPSSFAIQCWTGQGKGKKVSVSWKQCDYNVQWCTRYTDGNSWDFGCGTDYSNLDLKCSCNGYNDENFRASNEYLYCCNSDLCNLPSSIPEFDYFCNYNHMECYTGKNNGQPKKGLKKENCYYLGSPGYCMIEEFQTGVYNYNCGSGIISHDCECRGWARYGEALHYCCEGDLCNDAPPVFTGEICNSPPPPPPPTQPHPPTQPPVTFPQLPTEKPLPPKTPVPNVVVTTQGAHTVKTTPKRSTSSNSFAIFMSALILSLV